MSCREDSLLCSNYTKRDQGFINIGLRFRNILNVFVVNNCGAQGAVMVYGGCNLLLLRIFNNIE